MSTKRLPRTDSIQELARFWDTHDLTDFKDQLEEVTEPVFEREATITVRLPTNEAEAVHQVAQSQGVADADLIRAWVLEKIHST
jgi:predicted DNA binding CopG/RHH family protein